MVICFNSPKKLTQQAPYQSVAVCIFLLIMQFSAFHSQLEHTASLQEITQIPPVSVTHVMTSVLRALTPNPCSFYFKAPASMKPYKSHQSKLCLLFHSLPLYPVRFSFTAVYITCSFIQWLSRLLVTCDRDSSVYQTISSIYDSTLHMRRIPCFILEIQPWNSTME